MPHPLLQGSIDVQGQMHFIIMYLCHSQMYSIVVHVVVSASEAHLNIAQLKGLEIFHWMYSNISVLFGNVYMPGCNSSKEIGRLQSHS